MIDLNFWYYSINIKNFLKSLYISDNWLNSFGEQGFVRKIRLRLIIDRLNIRIKKDKNFDGISDELIAAIHKKVKIIGNMKREN